jgi:hypothetical protein
MQPAFIFFVVYVSKKRLRNNRVETSYSTLAVSAQPKVVADPDARHEQAKGMCYL